MAKKRFSCRFQGLLAAILVLILASAAWAVMPRYHYAQQSEESKIKAIATVEEVRVLDEGKQYTSKEVTFRLEYALTPDTPEVFTATCESVDQDWQVPVPGGTIYFYPVVGERVYVTVLSNGSQITSLTELTAELEQAIKEAPETIRYGFSRAHVMQ